MGDRPHQGPGGRVRGHGMMLCLSVPGTCAPKARPRTTFQGGRARTYTPKRSNEYAEMAAWLVKEACLKAGWLTIPYPQPVRLHVVFGSRRQATARPDVVNMLAQIADVLQSASVYDDDSQVVECKGVKIQTDEEATKIEVVAL